MSKFLLISRAVFLSVVIFGVVVATSRSIFKSWTSGTVYHREQEQYGIAIQKIETDKRDNVLVTLRVIDESPHPQFLKFRKSSITAKPKNSYQDPVSLSVQTREWVWTGPSEKYRGGSTGLKRVETPPLVESPPSNNTTTEADITLVFNGILKPEDVREYRLNFLDFYVDAQGNNLLTQWWSLSRDTPSGVLLFFSGLAMIPFLMFHGIYLLNQRSERWLAKLEAEDEKRKAEWEANWPQQRDELRRSIRHAINEIINRRR